MMRIFAPVHYGLEKLIPYRQSCVCVSLTSFICLFLKQQKYFVFPAASEQNVIVLFFLICFQVQYSLWE